LLGVGCVGVGPGVVVVRRRRGVCLARVVLRRRPAWLAVVGRRRRRTVVSGRRALGVAAAGHGERWSTERRCGDAFDLEGDDATADAGPSGGDTRGRLCVCVCLCVKRGSCACG
jgi:hypothetical protein